MMFDSLLARLRKRTIVVNETLFLTYPQPSHYQQWLTLRRESQGFLKPWEPEWPDDDLTPQGYQKRLDHYRKQRQRGTGLTFFLLHEKDDELLGGLSLSDISYKNMQTATLGYWMGEKHANKGFMQPSVLAIVEYAFHKMGLKQVAAGTMLNNDRSIHLLEKCGFKRRHIARDYLEINGKLEDHILFSISRDK